VAYGAEKQSIENLRCTRWSCKASVPLKLIMTGIGISKHQQRLGMYDIRRYGVGIDVEGLLYNSRSRLATCTELECRSAIGDIPRVAVRATALQATNIRVPQPCITSLYLSLIFTCLTDNVAMSLSRTPKMHPTLQPPLHVDDIHAAYRVSRTAGEENRAQLQDSRWLFMVATSLCTAVAGELSSSRRCCCP
jgi:hypothetical protein